MAKILHLIGNFDEDSGGAQRVILDIINTCNDPELKMGVCSLFGNATLADYLSENIFNVNLNHTNKYSFKIFLELYRIIFEWKPDLLHVHSSVVGVYGRPIAKIAGAKVIYTVHSDVRKTSLKNKIINKWTIGLSDAIICVSDLVKKSILEKYGDSVSGINIYTIWNSLDCTKFKRSICIDSAKKKKQLSIDQKNYILGTVGSLRPAKGYIYLLRAWKQVVAKYPNAVLLFAGNGEEKLKLQRLTKDIGISSSVFFLGPRSDVPEILNILDIFIFPSIHEGFGIALLEAMCMEKIIIASDIKPLNKIVGDCGLLVPVKNSEILGQQMVKVIDNLEDYKKLGQSAKERVEEKFSPREFGRKYLSVYKNILTNIAYE